MTLPPTYYDFIRKIRPFLADLSDKDASELLAGPHPSTAIESVDDYDSRFPQCIELVDMGILSEAASSLGMSVEQLKPHLGTALPEIRAHLASMYSTVNHEYHCMVNFTLAGKKTFHFSDNLAEHLANTEINLKAGLIKLPFPSCLFAFTSQSVINAMYNIRGDAGRREINASVLDYKAPVSVFLTELPPKPDLPGRRLVICAWHARLPDSSYMMLKRELYMGADWSLEQALRTDWETLTPGDLGTGMTVNLDDNEILHIADDTFYTDGFLFYRIILNAILYLSSDQSEIIAKVSPRREIEIRAKSIKSSLKRRKVLQTARRYSDLDYEEVGSSIGPILIQKSETESDVAGSSSGGKPLVRFMVRGHWRRQPYGPGGTERKLIWIRPYYKGPDLATVVNKPYLVK